MQNRTEYFSRTPRVPWFEGDTSKVNLVSDHYRLAFRAMLNLSQERALIPSLIPKKFHILMGFTVLYFEIQKS